MLRAAKRLMQRGDDQGAHRLRIAESELGLGRMHVHVDLVGRQGEEERKHGMPPVGHEVAVTAAHGAGEQLVAHRPAIDHEMLAEAVGAMQRGEAGEAFNGKRSARGAHGKRVGHELLAEDAAKPRKPMVEQPRRTRIEPQRGAVSGREAEGDLRVGERQALHHIGDGRGLGALGFHEFEPRRRRIEQVAHFDARALADRRRLELALRPPSTAIS